MSQLRERLQEKWRPILFMVVFLLLLALPLMFLLENFVRDAIVVPISYYVWLGGIVLDALPQGYLLVIALFILLYIALGSLRRRTIPIWGSQPPRQSGESAIVEWRERFALMAEGNYSSQRFAYHLGRLLLQTLAHEQRLTVGEMARRVEAEQAELPPEIRAYILKGMRPMERERRGFIAWLANLLRSAKFPGRTRPRKAQHIDRATLREIEQVLRFLEQRLQIKRAEAGESVASPQITTTTEVKP